MNKPRASLRHELLDAGATPKELAPLTSIASQLQSLEAVEAAPPIQKFKYRYALYGLTAALCLVVGMALVTFAQTSLPGNPLYGVKKLSEDAVVKVDPEYRAVVMMRRAEEVKQLVATNKRSSQVFTTLADYNAQAATYKMPSYATLEYCKANLEQAANKATPAERQAINKTLASLES